MFWFKVFQMNDNDYMVSSIFYSVIIYFFCTYLQVPNNDSIDIIEYYKLTKSSEPDIYHLLHFYVIPRTPVFSSRNRMQDRQRIPHPEINNQATPFC